VNRASVLSTSSAARFNARLDERYGEHDRELTKNEESLLKRLKLPSVMEDKVREVWAKTEHSKKQEIVSSIISFFISPLLITMLLVGSHFNDNFFLAKLDNLAVILMWVFLPFSYVILIIARGAAIGSTNSKIIYSKAIITTLLRMSVLEAVGKIMFFAVLYFLVCTGHFITTAMLIMFWVVSALLKSALKKRLKKIVALGSDFEKLSE
jgi:cation transport ATPase